MEEQEQPRPTRRRRGQITLTLDRTVVRQLEEVAAERMVAVDVLVERFIQVGLETLPPF